MLQNTQSNVSKHLKKTNKTNSVTSLDEFQKAYNEWESSVTSAQPSMGNMLNNLHCTLFF
jgi:DNA-binding transcriptional ArsR family regulator